MLDDTIERARARAEEDRRNLKHAVAAVSRRMQDMPAAALGRARGLTHQAAVACRANPAAVGMTVAGLAWLALAAMSRRAAASRQDEPALAGTYYEAITRWADDGGPVRGLPPDDPAPDGDDWPSRPKGFAAVGAKVQAKGKATIGAADRIADREPMALAAAGLLAGSVLAALVPETRAERRTLSPLRQALLGEARRILLDERQAGKGR